MEHAELEIQAAIATTAVVVSEMYPELPDPGGQALDAADRETYLLVVASVRGRWNDATDEEARRELRRELRNAYIRAGNETRLRAACLR